METNSYSYSYQTSNKTVEQPFEIIKNCYKILTDDELTSEAKVISCKKQIEQIFKDGTA